MNWIFDNIEIFIFVIVGIVSMFKSVLDAKAKKSAEADEVNDPQDYEDLEEEYHQPPPQPSVPPPLPWGGVASVPPPLQNIGYEAAAAEEAAKTLKHQQDLALHLQKIRETKATTTGGAAATRARIANKGAKIPTAQASSSLRARLKNPAEVRRAFVMREILDPPIALR